MSFEQARDELLEYAKWARIKSNKAMWFVPMSFYPSHIKSDPLNITHDRAYHIDSVLSDLKNHYPYEYIALTESIIARRNYREIAKRLHCSRAKVQTLIQGGVAWVDGRLYMVRN